MRRAAAALAMVVVTAAGCGGTRVVERVRLEQQRTLCRQARFGYMVCGYPLQPRVASEIWLRDSDRDRTYRIAGPATVVEQSPRPDGSWVAERLYRSPDGQYLLAQWSGECEAQSTYLIGAHGGRTRPILDPADESSALGWTRDGRAKILIPRALCGGSHHPAGIYAVDPATLRLTLLKRVAPRPGGP